MATLEVDRPTGTHVEPRYAALRGVKLGTVRDAFSPIVYRRSPARALAWLAFDVALYAICLSGAYFAPGLLPKLGFGVLAGCATAFLFVWAHDAAHGALFGFTPLAETLGTIAMLPSLNMYRLWIYGHNKVHHGFTSLSTIDWIWRPLTPEQYRAASGWSKLVYRVERSLPGCALHYVLRVWWPGMVTFRPEHAARRQRHFTLSKLIVAAYAVVASTLAWTFGGGIGGVLAAVIVPWIVFNYFIAMFVYLHHTHPQLPFFDERKEWSASIGQVACSSIVRTSAPVEKLTHGILLHTAHHVDTRIPFYRLEQACADLKQIYGDDIVEYRFRWSTVRSIFDTCKLFDFRTQTWYRFDDLARMPDGTAAS